MTVDAVSPIHSLHRQDVPHIFIFRSNFKIKAHQVLLIGEHVCTGDPVAMNLNKQYISNNVTSFWKGLTYQWCSLLAWYFSSSPRFSWKLRSAISKPLVLSIGSVTEGPPTTRRCPFTQSSSFNFLSSRTNVSLCSCVTSGRNLNITDITVLEENQVSLAKSQHGSMTYPCEQLSCCAFLI